MIIVLGSRHDPAAVGLVEAWHGAALCSAEDLGRPGWRLRSGCTKDLRWVVDGRVVPDRDITGVCVRRTTVYPEELSAVHAADRAYAAAECTALLVALLAATRARVVNPVREGALADAALRPERWLQMAGRLGIPVRPVRASSHSPGRRSRVGHVVTVLREHVWGSPSDELSKAARELVKTAGMVYGRVAFDERKRFVGTALQPRPTDDACAELGRYLAGNP